MTELQRRVLNVNQVQYVLTVPHGTTITGGINPLSLVLTVSAEQDPNMLVWLAKGLALLMQSQGVEEVRIGEQKFAAFLGDFPDPLEPEASAPLEPSLV